MSCQLLSYAGFFMAFFAFRGIRIATHSTIHRKLLRNYRGELLKWILPSLASMMLQLGKNGIPLCSTVNYTQFVINSNGYITFGSTSQLQTYPNPFQDQQQPTKVLSVHLVRI